jgi:uncharacterized protein involved in exopolysaccharide biosynthesis
MREPVEEIDIRDYLAMLWRHRLVILIAAVIAGALAFASRLTGPDMYESEVPVAVSRPKVSESGTDLTAVANFIPLISNRNVATQVIKEFSLDQSPYLFSPTYFFGSVVTVEEVPKSTILLVRGRLRDPQLLARLLNRVAQLGVESARIMSKREAEQARDDIKVQVDESRMRMQEAEGRLRQAREKSQLELLRKDIDAQLLERSGLLKLQIDLERERAELKRAEEDLASHKKTDVVLRTIDSDPALAEAARASGARDRDLLGMTLRAELVNSVYQTLDEAVAKHRAAVAGLERQRAELATRKLDRAELVPLQRLYAAEAEISRLEMEMDLSRKVYQEVQTSYERARLTVAARSSALLILDPAVVSDRPASRYAIRTGMAAFIGALMFGCLVFVLRHAFMSPSRA